MRRILAAVLILALGQAGTAARADDAHRLQVAREIVRTTHAADNLRRVMPTFMQQLRPMLEQSGGDQKAIDGFLSSFKDRFDSEAGSFVDLAAQVYAREFSEEDLDALLAFYGTPTGQHLLAKQLPITQGMMEAGRRWGEVMAKQVLEDFRKQKGQPPKL